MKHSIELLKENADSLQYAYNKYVEQGSVNKDSNIALENRVKYNDYKKAIEILNKFSTNDKD